jgi:AcrR family transcriptional regulator
MSAEEYISHNPRNGAPAGKALRLSAAARRKQIIEQALGLISAAGYNAVSVANVATACGVAKSLVLHYFPTTADLLAAVLAYRDERAFVEFVSTTPQPFTATSARELATSIVHHNLGQREMLSLHHILEAEALFPQHPAHRYFVERTQKMHAFNEMLMGWKADPHIAAIEFAAFWGGLERLWLQDADLDFVSVWNSFCDRFFAA